MICMVSNADDIDANNGRWKKGGWVKTGDWGLSSFLCSLPRNSPVHCRSAGPAQSSKRHGCHNHTQARITASSGVKSASLHLILFFEALLMWLWSMKTLNQHIDEARNCNVAMKFTTNQWIGIQEPQTEYYSLVQPVLVKAFKKMASVGQRYALELERRKRVEKATLVVQSAFWQYTNADKGALSISLYNRLLKIRLSKRFLIFFLE